MPLATAFVPYLAIVAFLLTATFLGWRLLSYWSAIPSKKIPLIGYAILMTAALIVSRNAVGWGYAAAGCAVALAVLGSTPSYTIKPEGRRVLPLTAGILLVPLILTGANGAWHQVSLARSARTNAQSIIQALHESAATAQDKAQDIADLAAVQSLDVSPTAFASLRQEALSRSLDFIILTDATGTVLERTDLAGSSGDNLPDRMPWTARGRDGEIVSGVAWSQNGQLIAAAAVPVKRNGTQVGMAVVGNAVDAAYLRAVSGRRSAVILDGQRVAAYSAASPLDANLATNEGLSYQAEKRATFALELGGKQAVAVTSSLLTLDPTHPFRLVMLSDE